MDITQIDPLFDKWMIDQEALSGVLNSTETKRKNESFQRMLEQWRKQTGGRRRIKDKIIRDDKKIRDDLISFLKKYGDDPELINVQSDYW